MDRQIRPRFLGTSALIEKEFALCRKMRVWSQIRNRSRYQLHYYVIGQNQAVETTDSHCIYGRVH
jgi:hypothetical protein